MNENAIPIAASARAFHWLLYHIGRCILSGSFRLFVYLFLPRFIWAAALSAALKWKRCSAQLPPVSSLTTCSLQQRKVSSKHRIRYQSISGWVSPRSCNMPFCRHSGLDWAPSELRSCSKDAIWGRKTRREKDGCDSFKLRRCQTSNQPRQLAMKLPRRKVRR